MTLTRETHEDHESASLPPRYDWRKARTTCGKPSGGGLRFSTSNSAKDWLLRTLERDVDVFDDFATI